MRPRPIVARVSSYPFPRSSPIAKRGKSAQLDLSHLAEPRYEIYATRIIFTSCAE